MKLVGQSTILTFDPYSSTNSDASAQETQDLGAVVALGDGRTFKYGKAGASNTGAGKLEVAPTPKTNHHNLAVLAAAAGATTVNVTLGATAAVADEYDEGFLAINAGPGVGQTYRIGYQPAIGSGLAGNITLADPISTALTTSSKATLIHNQLNGFIEGTSQTKRVAGVGLIGLTAANFGWLQTKGVAGVLADQTIALGSLIVPSTSVAGSVIAISGTYATALVTTIVGQASILAGVDTEYRAVVLGIEQ